MSIAPITTNGPTITVSNAQELKDAYELLSHDNGGTILMEGGDYGRFSLYTYGENFAEKPVVLKSVDADDPAHFTGFYLREVENIRIENVHVDSTADGIGDNSLDLMVQNASNIQIVDSVFLHDTDNAVISTGARVDSLAHIRDSSDIVFSGNYVDGYSQALQVTEVDGMEVIGNELTNMQGDGFRGGGLQNLTIADNYMHDFYGSDQTLNHSDLIQIWGSNAKTLTENVTITGNTLITSDAASQSIFIRNEEFGKAGDPTAGYFTNVTVTDNLIYNGHINGIRVEDTIGLDVDGNTMIWNPDADMVYNGVSYVSEPNIYIKNVTDVSVTNNITHGMTLPDGASASGNKYLTYDDPNAATYAGNHFVNPFAGKDITATDLFMQPSSTWYGLHGSSIGTSPSDVSDGVIAVISTSVSDADQYEITFDARSSFGADGITGDQPGYSYHWSFADGSTTTGATVTKAYDSGGFKGVNLSVHLNGEEVAEITRNVAVQTKDVFAFDFENGVVDISDGVSEVIDNGRTASDNDDTGFRIGDGNKLELGRKTDGMFELDTFGLALDLTPTGDENSGIFLHLNQTMQGSITKDGSFKFDLTTDQGTYSLTSREPIFDDGEAHRIGIAFDGNSGQLELFADGESVSSTEAWGTTPSVKYWNLVFGNTWNDSMDAIIDNVVMNVDPVVAGDLPEPTATPPQMDVPQPAETPSANEAPPAEPDEPTMVEPDVPAQPEQPSAERDDPVQPEQPSTVEREEPTQPEEPAMDDRGAPPESIDPTEDTGFLEKLFDMILSLFGLGGDDDDEAPTVVETAGLTLSDIVPVTCATGDCDLPADDEDDEDAELEIAA